MARIKGGLNAKKKHNRVLKLAKGYRGARSKQYRVAKQSVMRALTSAYAGRKQKKRQFRQLWIARINAAARMNGLSYSKFMYGLKLAGVELIGMLYLFLAWKGKRMIMVSGQELVEEPQEARKVALTFDDGPSEYTVELSRGLKERGVQATFFLLGENMEGRRKMVEELVKDGHLIGNHSYHHVQLNKLSIEEATGEIEKTNRLIREWTGEAPVYIRPPYGAWSQELEKVVDMIPVFWNVDSLDWKLQNKEQVLSCLSGQVEEGDVILMHDGYQSSVDAAFALVDHLQKQGFVFVNVEEMILE